MATVGSRGDGESNGKASEHRRRDPDSVGRGHVGNNNKCAERGFMPVRGVPASEGGAVKPLCIDLYCGLGGWAEGFLSEGYEVIGFDIERRPYPATLVLQDVLTLWGSQLKDATVIVGSSPCQEFSYRAMPWKRAKELPPPNLGIQLFNAQFFLQKEASEAAGRYIPMVVENVCGAQPWVGRARWHYGSYYLWGDVPAVMPFTTHKKGAAPIGTDAPRDMRRNEDGEYTRMGLKVPGIKLSEVAFNVAAAQRHRAKHNTDAFPEDAGIKQHGFGSEWFDKALDERRRDATATKNGGDWFGSGENCSLQRKQSSRSDSRKAASAAIAKIPFPLAQHIARCFKPGCAR